MRNVVRVRLGFLFRDIRNWHAMWRAPLYPSVLPVPHNSKDQWCSHHDLFNFIYGDFAFYLDMVSRFLFNLL